MGNEKSYQLNAGKNGGINVGGGNSGLTVFKFVVLLAITIAAFAILNVATSESTGKTAELRARTEIALCHMGYGKEPCANLESSFQSKFGSAK
ncbi:hypothetical protein HX780_29450 [Pseudomonas tolaasii]|uniref:hypothetical protein n=1 Tax=Pseudomonas tolaasii TaxID=29442 RepID=UPI0015A1BD2C|nr:hypothetical protein [Pseudomonas tolaasii]NVZ45538.1 hypothetical protein [Pseudomonas tolaasii]NWA52432.1 hypothetical protein [Pseudomonas tolaasii]NWE66644.1 hypothetical protein [Pseudomonas tolaasii]WLH49718.1 hypothetical protein PSH62_16620 [Pseudomonas tolaasii]